MAESSLDGGHLFFKVTKQFKQWKPEERVQLRDEAGHFLSKQKEIAALRGYPDDLFGTGVDFLCSI